MAKTILVLVWLGATGTERAHERDLQAWANAHELHLRPAISIPPTPSHRQNDPKLAAEIEHWLEQARLAAGADDDAGARATLDRVDSALRAHPELPAAAWLMAERFSLEAQLAERRPEQQPRATELRRAAFALEGARSVSFKSSETPADPTRAVSVRVSGLAAGDQLEWDGMARTVPLRTLPGLHQARVLRQSRLISAQWIHVGETENDVQLATPRPASCSLEELAPTRVHAGRVVPPDVTCEQWAVARASATGGVEIASCRRSRCNSLQIFRASQAFGKEREREGAAWASVTPYALAGLGFVAVTAVVLWRVGAFDKPSAEPDRVVFSGPAAIRF
jgi:hypothetical protein